ncbi:hypothetical protein [Aerococcus urinaeequi]|uniref:hypothetical protein n=1 Tax=Aerococcus urinaeequi TaxID=51665 RepID=UPI002891750D|nr:hypothetical protein [Aerococcus urinaeequi]MDT2762665.1 hypothetical protein [Aerococcus urinaeequi]
MVQIGSQISLYKQLTNDLMNEVKVVTSLPNFTYNNSGKEISITLDDDYNDVLNINKYNSDWDPSIHNLALEQSFEFKNPSLLYGDSGLTMPGNQIGLAAHIHSRRSNFQRTVKIGVIDNAPRPVKITYFENFEAGTLRGEINLDYFLYLENYQTYNPTQATEVGMVLSGYLSSTSLIVDGDGSVFPMSEFNEVGGPLWRLEQNWADPIYDSFDISNINLQLNVKHQLFKDIKDGKNKMSQLMMMDIMVQAMSLIIQEVYSNKEYTDEDLQDASPDSILMAVNYWISTYSVDTTTATSISNSLRDYWHRVAGKGGI